VRRLTGCRQRHTQEREREKVNERDRRAGVSLTCAVFSAQVALKDPMPATRRAPLGGGKPPPPAPGDLAAAATAAATKAIAAANAAQRAALRAAFATRERTISPSPSLGCVEGGAAAVAPSEEGGGGLTPSRRASAAPSSSPGSAAPPPAPPPLGPSDAAAAAASAVSARYPGREGQVRALSAALGLPNDWPRHVLVHGPPSVGKTAVVRCVVFVFERRDFCLREERGGGSVPPGGPCHPSKHHPARPGVGRINRTSHRGEGGSHRSGGPSPDGLDTKKNFARLRFFSFGSTYRARTSLSQPLRSPLSCQ